MVQMGMGVVGGGARPSDGREGVERRLNEDVVCPVHRGPWLGERRSQKAKTEPHLIV